MALRFADKKEVVSSINAQFSSALSIALADYQGLTVAQMTELRETAKSQAVELCVVRNTLAKHALKDTDHGCLERSLVGPTLMALSQEDLGSPARVLSKFSENNKALEIKAFSVAGEFYEASEVGRIAKLPTRAEVLAQLMCLMLAPVQKLAQTINEVPAKLVRTVAAVRDSRES